MNNPQMILGAALITILCFAAVCVGARILWKQSRPKVDETPSQPEPGAIFYGGTRFAKFFTFSQIAEKNERRRECYAQLVTPIATIDGPQELELWESAYLRHCNRLSQVQNDIQGNPIVLFNEDGTTTQLADREQVKRYRAARAADFDLNIIKQRMPATGEKQGSNDSE